MSRCYPRLLIEVAACLVEKKRPKLRQLQESSPHSSKIYRTEHEPPSCCGRNVGNLDKHEGDSHGPDTCPPGRNTGLTQGPQAAEEINSLTPLTAVHVSPSSQGHS